MVRVPVLTPVVCDPDPEPVTSVKVEDARSVEVRNPDRPGLERHLTPSLEAP